MINDTQPALSDYPPNGTIFDKLDAAGVSWRDYYTTLPTVELYPQLFLRNNGTKVVPIADFFTDAAAGALPGYCLVEPDYENQSEENPQNIAVGEQFAAQVISAVMSGAGLGGDAADLDLRRARRLLRPRAAAGRASRPMTFAPLVTGTESAYNGFAQYGFRVPCAVVSPWARPHYVSHQVMDHTSICALVESKWNLPAMTLRDANASNMLDLLDLRRPHFLKPPPLAQPLLATDPGALACSTSGPGTIPPPGSVTPPRRH